MFGRLMFGLGALALFFGFGCGDRVKPVEAPAAQEQEAETTHIGKYKMNNEAYALVYLTAQQYLDKRGEGKKILRIPKEERQALLETICKAMDKDNDFYISRDEILVKASSKPKEEQQEEKAEAPKSEESPSPAPKAVPYDLQEEIRKTIEYIRANPDEVKKERLHSNVLLKGTLGEVTTFKKKVVRNGVEITIEYQDRSAIRKENPDESADMTGDTLEIFLRDQEEQYRILTIRDQGCDGFPEGSGMDWAIGGAPLNAYGNGNHPRSHDTKHSCFWSLEQRRNILAVYANALRDFRG